MKYTCRSWLKLTKIALLSFLAFSSLNSVAQQATQTLSFESDSIITNEDDGTVMDLIESKDGGFYLLTYYYLFKIDRYGKIEWKFSVYDIEASIYVDSVYDNVAISIWTRFLRVDEDEDGIYLYGFFYPKAVLQPYYAHLSFEGKVIFDTCYCSYHQLYDTDTPIWGSMANVVTDQSNIYFVTHVPL
ncbi:MAG: hypothetical protein KF882_09710, partial [Bacteroidia bacterium]|nr:hypothetical protein [Bacteroidia bacterium]